MADPITADNRSAIAKSIAFLSGKKTYLIGVAGIIYAAGIHFLHWPNDSEIWGGLGFTGAMTLRAAIKKLCLTFAADSTLNDAPAEAARRLAGPGVPAILIAASLPFLRLMLVLVLVLMIGFASSGCSTTQVAQNPVGAAVISKVSNNVIDKGLNAGATRIDTGNPYLHSVAVGLRSVEGQVLTAADVQKIFADYGDPANTTKFKTLALDVWDVIRRNAGKIGWAAITEAAAQGVQTGATNPAPTSP